MLTAPQLVTSQPWVHGQLQYITNIGPQDEKQDVIPKGKTVGLCLMMIVLLSGNFFYNMLI
jgi:hypothetical protein